MYVAIQESRYWSFINVQETIIVLALTPIIWVLFASIKPHLPL